MSYQNSVPQFKLMLTNLNKFIDKAVSFAETKKFDPNTLMEARLAPDMFPFVKQVQVACDMAKFTVAYLTEQVPPKHEDNEKTVDDVRARIKKVLTYLDTFKPEHFNGCEDRRITLKWMPGKYMMGSDYLTQMGLPNFYFHIGAAYMILRNNGVDIGKMDFLGNVNFKDL